MHSAGTLLGGKYRLDERIGAGGMGEVWRATDEKLERPVAVKVMQPALLEDPGFRQRFRAEARAMARVAHRGVVAVHDFDDDESGAFLVMEYVDGESLSTVLRRDARLPAQWTMELMAQAARALHAAHERGIVHRDVKPANLLIRRDRTAVLTDFGIARLQEGTQLTVTGALLGTLSYLAPEQVLGEPATARSDVYALGVVAYECLTGRRPFDRESAAATMMARVQEAPPTLPAEVPPVVRAVLEKALTTDPAHRWASAAELADACQVAATPIRTPPVPAAGLAPPAVRAVASVPPARRPRTDAAPPPAPAASATTPSGADPGEPWLPAGIDPIAIALPGREAAGYTLRAFRPAIRRPLVAAKQETPVFLSNGGRLLLFATPEALVSFVRSGAPHDLARLDTWDTLAESVRPHHVLPGDDDTYELDLVVLNLRGGHDAWDPPLLISAGEIARDLGHSLKVSYVISAMAPGSPLDELDEALRGSEVPGLTGMRARRRLRTFATHTTGLAWRSVIGHISKVVDWRD